MNATLYYHLRNEKAEPVIKCVAKPATGEYDTPYYELHLGDAVMFVDDGLCRRILDVLASRPDLPKTDAELDRDAADQVTNYHQVMEERCPTRQ